MVTVPGGPKSAFDRQVGHRRHSTSEDLIALLETTGFAVSQGGRGGFPAFDLYRTGIARGERLVTDVDAARGVPLAARLAMGVFDKLLAASPTRGRRGWQLYATATVPPAPPPA